MSDEAPISARNAIFACNACLRAHITRHVDSMCTYSHLTVYASVVALPTEIFRDEGRTKPCIPRREAVSYAGYPGRSTRTPYE